MRTVTTRKIPYILSRHDDAKNQESNWRIFLSNPFVPYVPYLFPFSYFHLIRRRAWLPTPTTCWKRRSNPGMRVFPQRFSKSARALWYVCRFAVNCNIPDEDRLDLNLTLDNLLYLILHSCFNNSRLDSSFLETLDQESFSRRPKMVAGRPLLLVDWLVCTYISFASLSLLHTII